MKQPALHMRLLAAILLTALCLSACGGETPRQAEATPPESAGTSVPTEHVGETTPVSQTGSAALSETSNPAGQTEPVLPDKEPEYGLDSESGKIASVSIGTPEEWNRFARDFNGGRDRFAASLDVFIETQLSFADTVFVALQGGFAGRIYGPERGEKNVFEENADGIYGKHNLIVDMATGVSGRYWRDYPPSAGFSDIHAVEEGYSLFGGDNGDVTIENLNFCEIGYTVKDVGDFTGDYPLGMLCTKADFLTLDEVIFLRCDFRPYYKSAGDIYHMPLPLLAGEAEGMRLYRVIAANCSALSDYDGNGLLFHTVAGDASFSELYLMGCSVTGVSGDYGLLSLLGYLVGGKADYEDITMFDCRTYGRCPSAFGRADSVGTLRNITVENCNFTTPQGSLAFSGSSSLLFFMNGKLQDYPDGVWYDLEGKTLEGVAPENVVFANCVTTLIGKDFDWYRNRGITIENCLNVTTGPAKRAYQQWMYGEVYD